jgi:hypothetical protein
MRINANTDSSIYKSFLNAINKPTNASSRLTLQGDSIDLSSLGKGLAGKLVIRNNDVATNDMNSVNSLSDPSMRLMGKSLVEVKEMLEEMKTLAESAQDSSLSWDDRIDLQIEMTYLQAKLHNKIYNMGMSVADPSRAGTFIDFNILDQRDRTIMFLEEMRAGGPIANRGNITNFADDSPVSRIIQYAKTDFELDENGYLKMRDELFSALPEDTMISLDETLKGFSNWLYPTTNLTDEEIKANLGLSLLDAGSAAESLAAIQEQIGTLTEVEAEFNRLATVDPTVIYQYEGSDTSAQGLFLTVLGLMKHRSEDDDGQSKDPLDVRLVKANDPIGNLFAKIDKVLKDKVYASLGFGDLYKNEQKPKGISPEQLAIIEKTRAKAIARDASREHYEKPLDIPILDLESAATKTL